MEFTFVSGFVVRVLSIFVLKGPEEGAVTGNSAVLSSLYCPMLSPLELDPVTQAETKSKSTESSL